MFSCTHNIFFKLIFHGNLQLIIIKVLSMSFAGLAIPHVSHARANKTGKITWNSYACIVIRRSKYYNSIYIYIYIINELSFLICVSMQTELYTAIWYPSVDNCQLYMMLLYSNLIKFGTAEYNQLTLYITLKCEKYTWNEVPNSPRAIYHTNKAQLMRTRSTKGAVKNNTKQTNKKTG